MWRLTSLTAFKRLTLVSGSLKLLLLPPAAAATGGEQARERDWANVITAHAGEPAAYTWRLAHFTLGQHALLPPDAPQQQHLQAGPPVSAVGISCCGNFGLVGTEGGRVDRYNLQSGIHRGTFWRQTPSQQQQQQAGVAGEGRTGGEAAQQCTQDVQLRAPEGLGVM